MGQSWDDDDTRSDSRPKEPQPWVMGMIGGIGLTACALAFVAEALRRKSYQYLEDAEKTLYCVYPASTASWYAVAAILLLATAQAATFLYGGFAWIRATKGAQISNTRTLVILVLVAELSFTLSSLGLLITGAIENSYHSNSVPYGQGMVHCSLVDKGVFLSGGFLAFFGVVCMEAYYFLGVRALQEAWVYLYNEPPVVDMEAFSKDASRTSITSVISRDQGSISNTPVYEPNFI